MSFRVNRVPDVGSGRVSGLLISGFLGSVLNRVGLPDKKTPTRPEPDKPDPFGTLIWMHASH